jgi:hypothetical protein
LFFREFETRFADEIKKRMGAEAFMVKDIMYYRLKKFLSKERLRKVKSILFLEERQPAGLIKLGAKHFKFKYRIDRIDLLDDGSVLVLDYKTGHSPKGPEPLDKLERMGLGREEIKKNIHSFQLPIYFYFTRGKFKEKPLNAALYGLRDLDLSYFIKPDKLDTAARVTELCLAALEATIAEITNPAVDFYPDKTDMRTCQYCAFSALCR